MLLVTNERSLGGYWSAVYFENNLEEWFNNYYLFNRRADGHNY